MTPLDIMTCICSVHVTCDRFSSGAAGLTCSLLDDGVVLVEAAAGADGDVVEASGHQRVEHTLRTGLGHRHGVQRPVPVTQGHQVTLHLTWSWTPRHAEEVRLTVITDRHLPDSSWDWGGLGKV